MTKLIKSGCYLHHCEINSIVTAAWCKLIRRISVLYVCTCFFKELYM